VPAGGGTPTPVSTLDSAHGDVSHRWPWFLPDGRHFLFYASASRASHRHARLPGRQFGHFNEDGAAFSPDTHWIAYTSDESGSEQVYVQPFPPTGAKYEISRSGGARRRLYAVTKDGQRFLVAASQPRSNQTLPTVVVNWTEQLKARVPTQ
jgi:hypothetical protein